MVCFRGLPRLAAARLMGHDTGEPAWPTATRMYAREFVTRNDCPYREMSARILMGNAARRRGAGCAEREARGCGPDRDAVTRRPLASNRPVRRLRVRAT